MPLPLNIDRESPIPLYYQLKEQLALLIRNGTLAVGSQLPTELEISQALQISRGTVRQAINALVAEGRLRRVQGSGTFVTRPSPTILHLTQRFTSFAEDMRAGDVPYTTRLISGKIIPAEGRLLSKLALQVGDPVIYLERLGFVEGEPFVLAFTYIPEALCPGLLDQDLSQPLYSLLEHTYGLRLSRASRTLEAALADKYEATLLKLPVGAPIHFMHNLAYLADGRPVEYSRLRFRGDRSRISFEVTR